MVWKQRILIFCSSCFFKNGKKQQQQIFSSQWMSLLEIFINKPVRKWPLEETCFPTQEGWSLPLRTDAQSRVGSRRCFMWPPHGNIVWVAGQAPMSLTGQCSEFPYLESCVSGAKNYTCFFQLLKPEYSSLCFLTLLWSSLSSHPPQLPLCLRQISENNVYYRRPQPVYGC